MLCDAPDLTRVPGWQQTPDLKALFLAEAERRGQTNDQHRRVYAVCTRSLTGSIVPSTVFSQSLKVETPSRSPQGKYCPTRLRLWEDCPARQQATKIASIQRTYSLIMWSDLVSIRNLLTRLYQAREHYRGRY
jgi:hypothetical protein